MKTRSSGILLHPTCLANPYGIGDLGPAAYRFVDALAEAGQSIWQVLALNPTDSGHGNSPYHSTSAFAGNPLLISPRMMVEEEWLDAADPTVRDTAEGRVDFARAIEEKTRFIDAAFERFSSVSHVPDFENFCDNADWLEDYALFETIRRQFPGRTWAEWPKPLRERRPDALDGVREKSADAILRCKFEQYLFFHQWEALKTYCNKKKIRIFGDIPIYMPLESADVWTRPDQFKLDGSGHPEALSGVPPDYFSVTGQLWGHPVYRWDVMTANGYDWWMQRIEHNLWLSDIIRIDHFRGLVAYWEVPPHAETALRGRWVDVPADDFFNKMFKRFGCLPLVAEDLGSITPEVRECIAKFGFPGMRVLQFAFGDDFPTSTHLPHFHEKNCIVYPGTHDNNTMRGWFEEEADEKTLDNLKKYMGGRYEESEIHWDLIRLSMMSVADTVILPLQDVLGNGSEARMNRPGKGDGNWAWRMPENALNPDVLSRLRDMTETYGRV